MTPEQLARALSARAFAQHRERAMHKAVLLAEAAAKRRTPVRTGHLRRSETSRVEDGGLRGLVGTNVEYAPMVHRRKPFFELAIADTRKEIVDMFEAAADTFLREASQ